MRHRLMKSAVNALLVPTMACGAMMDAALKQAGSSVGSAIGKSVGNEVGKQVSTVAAGCTASMMRNLFPR